MTSQRLMISRIGPIIRYSHFPTRIGPVIRYFSTHTNGARVDARGFSFLGMDWSDVLSFFAELVVKKGCAIVPEGSAYLIERSRKYDRTLPPGLNFMIPLKDRVSHIHSLRVRPLTLFVQHLFSKDNVEMKIEACLFYKVVDPVLASYEVENTIESMSLLADSIIRKNVGGKSFDKILHEREILNKNIVMDLCDDFKGWGLHVLNFEIRDISLSPNMTKSIMMEACGRFKKRAKIIKSEAGRESINIIAGAKKSASILIAEGEAKALELKEEAKARAISALSKAMVEEAADRAVKFRVLRQSIETFGKIAELGTTVILPK